MGLYGVPYTPNNGPCDEIADEFDDIFLHCLVVTGPCCNMRELELRRFVVSIPLCAGDRTEVRDVVVMKVLNKPRARGHGQGDEVRVDPGTIKIAICCRAVK